MTDKIKVAVVGLQFGAEFVPIYRDHPDVSRVAVCDLDSAKLNAVAGRFGIADRFARLEEVLASDYDAVHLFTPVPLHVEQTLAVLGAEFGFVDPVALVRDARGAGLRFEGERTRESSGGKRFAELAFRRTA